MDYFVYTDGSCKPTQNIASSSFIVMSKFMYYKADCSAFRSTYAFEAEVNAIAMSINYMLDNMELTKNDTITLHVDSKKAIDLLNSVINKVESDDARVPIYQYFKARVERFYATGAYIKCVKVRAHQEYFNTNKVVDRLAKLAIVYYQVQPQWG